MDFRFRARAPAVKDVITALSILQPFSDDPDGQRPVF